MSVGRAEQGNIWWKCHRASCSFVGNEKSSSYAGEHSPVEPKYQRVFAREKIPLALEEALFQLYSIDGDTMDRAGWAYTPDYDGFGARVIFPVFGPDGEIRGEQFRSYSGDAPKAFTTGYNVGENLMCWYQYKKYGKTLVIVEDIPSALRLAQDGKVNAVALLGTVLNFDRINEIKAQEYDRVWLCLDKDATFQAIKYRLLFDDHLPQMLVKPLGNNDIKDMPYQEFNAFMKEITTDAISKATA
jgi:DNA primase (bacterial type)